MVSAKDYIRLEGLDPEKLREELHRRGVTDAQISEGLRMMEAKKDDWRPLNDDEIEQVYRLLAVILPQPTHWLLIWTRPTCGITGTFGEGIPDPAKFMTETARTFRHIKGREIKRKGGPKA